MLGNLDKVILAGLGAFSMTRERAEKVFDDLVRRGQEEKTNRHGFVKDVMDAAKSARKDIEDVVNQQVQHALSKLNVATKDDLIRLEAKVEQARPKTAKSAARPRAKSRTPKRA